MHQRTLVTSERNRILFEPNGSPKNCAHRSEGTKFNLSPQEIGRRHYQQAAEEVGDLRRCKFSGFRSMFLPLVSIEIPLVDIPFIPFRLLNTCTDCLNIPGPPGLDTCSRFPKGLSRRWCPILALNVFLHGLLAAQEPGLVAERLALWQRFLMVALWLLYGCSTVALRVACLAKLSTRFWRCLRAARF